MQIFGSILKEELATRSIHVYIDIHVHFCVERSLAAATIGIHVHFSIKDCWQHPAGRAGHDRHPRPYTDIHIHSFVQVFGGSDYIHPHPFLFVQTIGSILKEELATSI